MKSIACFVLMFSVAIFSDARGDDLRIENALLEKSLTDAGLACMAHIKAHRNEVEPEDYQPSDYQKGFERCAPLVKRLIVEWRLAENALLEKSRARDVGIINKGLLAAGLPLLQTE